MLSKCHNRTMTKSVGRELLSRRRMVWCLALVGLLMGTACRPATRVPAGQFLNGRTMGTTYSIKLVSGPGMADLLTISREIEAELAAVNAQMSTYLATSEISRFNAFRSQDWFPVSSETAQVAAQALELSALSDGAFDVTVGPLVNLWGFGPGPRQQQPPSPEAIERALAAVGSDKLAVRLQPPALQKSVPGLYVDLSAIAKGHGVDRCAAVLDRLHCPAYFIEIGGEVRTKGTKADGSPWRVGIERPAADQRSVQRALPLSDQALATSGNYRQFFEANGHRYSHTIDPRTGQPVADSIASASVVADTCAKADGIATALMAAGFEKGLALAEQHAWSVLLIRPAAAGEFETAESTAFQALFGPEGVN